MEETQSPREDNLHELYVAQACDRLDPEDRNDAVSQGHLQECQWPIPLSIAVSLLMSRLLVVNIFRQRHRGSPPSNYCLVEIDALH